MSWSHLNDTRPKARKPHNCFLCGMSIPAGETYVRRSGITSDGLLCFAMHVPCESKTRSWGQDEWDCHDPDDFRHYELEPAR